MKRTSSSAGLPVRLFFFLFFPAVSLPLFNPPLLRQTIARGGNEEPSERLRYEWRMAYRCAATLNRYRATNTTSG
ncbi:hypothetical protein B0J11DRAFT_279275 [Dendryphion nanum]|uniref:Secreted protein n=1 Tax=Dendryphion nanum TaxID=256645 RepID=A0A9P9DYG8_9PLEO|nr:hypothetical protein B0J11DRAFT_279275 [Dendryphion nanum]